MFEASCNSLYRGLGPFLTILGLPKNSNKLQVYHEPALVANGINSVAALNIRSEQLKPTCHYSRLMPTTTSGIIPTDYDHPSIGFGEHHNIPTRLSIIYYCFRQLSLQQCSGYVRAQLAEQRLADRLSTADIKGLVTILLQDPLLFYTTRWMLRYKQR
jgi:hypothetical protein